MSDALVIQTACDTTQLLLLPSISEVSIYLNPLEPQIVLNQEREIMWFLLNQEKLST